MRDAVDEFVDGLRTLLNDRNDDWSVPETLEGGALLRLAGRHMLIPYLRGNSHRIEAAAETKEALAKVGTRMVMRAMQRTDQLRTVHGLLDSNGVRVLAFKGPSLSLQAYGGPGLRGVGDLDLLVSPNDVARAVDVLLEAGWVHRVHGDLVPSDSWVWRYHLATTYETQLVGHGVDIDLHWRLSPAIGDLPPFDELWAARTNIALPGAQIATLSPTHALQHACSHAAKDGWSWLRNLVDIFLLDRLVDAPPMTRMQTRSLELARSYLGEGRPARGRTAQKAARALRAVPPVDSDEFNARRTLRRFRRVMLKPTPMNAVLCVADIVVPSQRLAGREGQSKPVAVIGGFGAQIRYRIDRHKSATGMRQ